MCHESPRTQDRAMLISMRAIRWVVFAIESKDDGYSRVKPPVRCDCIAFLAVNYRLLLRLITPDHGEIRLIAMASLDDVNRAQERCRGGPGGKPTSIEVQSDNYRAGVLRG